MDGNRIMEGAISALTSLKMKAVAGWRSIDLS